MPTVMTTATAAAEHIGERLPQPFSQDKAGFERCANKADMGPAIDGDQQCAPEGVTIDRQNNSAEIIDTGSSPFDREAAPYMRGGLFMGSIRQRQSG